MGLVNLKASILIRIFGWLNQIPFMRKERRQACRTRLVPGCLVFLKLLTPTSHNMADAYFDAETIPLTSVVGGRIDLAVQLKSWIECILMIILIMK